MEESDINDFLVEHFVADNDLQSLIESEKSLKKLCNYLRWRCRRIEKNISAKCDFEISKILVNNGSPFHKKEALKWALTLQSSNVEFIKCLEWFNIELKLYLNNESTEEQFTELYCIFEVIINFDYIVFNDILKYICFSDLKTFLLKLTDTKPNNEYYCGIYDTLLKCLNRIIAEEPDFMQEVLNYAIRRENLNFLCILFNKRLIELAENNLLQEKELWNLVKDHMVTGNIIKKKQALSILISTLEFIKDGSYLIPDVLKSDSNEVWDLYFTLLDISKEKQLHLIKPTLKLLPSISTLHITWQLALYKMLLNHSQNFVIYKTIEYLLDLKFEDDDMYRELFKNILMALNKYECSDLSKNTHRKLGLFCSKMNENWCNIFFAEFLEINWNPIATWCILRTASPILHKVKQEFIKKMIRILANLSHPFIRSNCTFLFLREVFAELEERPEYDPSLIPVTLEVGGVLLFTDNKIDVEIFEKIVKLNICKFVDSRDKLRQEADEVISQNNEQLSFIYLKLIKISKINMYSKISSFSRLPSTIDINIMLDLNKLGPVGITDYILCGRDTYSKKKLFEVGNTHVQKNHYKYLSKIPDEFVIGNEGNWIDSEAYKAIRHYYSKLQTVTPTDDTGLEIISYKDLSDKFKSASEIKQYLEYSYIRNKWWMTMYKLSPSKDPDDEIVFEDKFRAMLDTGDEKLFLLFVENLDLLSHNLNTKKLPDIAYIYDECFRRICELPSHTSRYYAEIFFASTLHPSLFSSDIFSGYLKKWCIDLRKKYFSECVSVLIVILKKFRDLIYAKAPNLHILLPLSLVALFQVSIIQKTERVEYEIYQDIHHHIGEFGSFRNPNIMAMELKMLALETMYLLSENNDSTVADEIVDTLLDSYQKHYGKRYFPESKVHLEKLRIVQALLILANFLKNSKSRLIPFILNSFCEETHQNSVKQLLQWLLIILMSSDTSEHLKFLIEKINTANLTQPSFVVSLIPILYHSLLSSNNIEYWNNATDALLSWAMGANFKLRVYSQVTLKRLLEMAEEKKLEEYTAKYNFILKPILKVLESTGNAAQEVLKNDLAFIESFDPKLHYCIENIFVTLPKIDVPHSEWENIAEYEFSSKFNIKVKNDADISHFKKVNIQNLENLETEDDSTGINIQKKIIPWKYALEENVSRENLSDLIVVASLLEKRSNLGGLSRTCEVFSVKQFVLHNVKIKDDKEFKNLSMSSENWINFLEVKRDDLSIFLTNMRQLGYCLIGLEQTLESVKLNEYKFEKKTVLILGNEKEGIPATLLPLMDACVEIPQFGQTRSLNVHVAAATCIWEYVGQHFFCT